ncbi:hypothetical protein [Psychrobacter sp. KH172YL61]|nr:hypothetical protein [Psychrobacter sp. KH172YL61]
MNPFKQAPIVRQAIIGTIKRTGNKALQVLGRAVNWSMMYRCISR